MRHSIQPLQDGQRVGVTETKVSMINLDLDVRLPNLKIRISNCYDRLTASILISAIMTLRERLLSPSHGTIKQIIHDYLKMNGYISFSTQ